MKMTTSHFTTILIVVIMCVFVGGSQDGRMPDGPVLKWLVQTGFYANMVINIEKQSQYPQGITVVTSTDLQSISQVSALDMITGDKVWVAPTGWAGIRRPVVLSEVICTVAGAKPCRLRCYPVSSGDLVWGWEQPGGDSLSGAAVSEELQLLFLVSVNTDSTQSTTYAIKHSSGEVGVVVWSVQHNYTMYDITNSGIPPTPTYDPNTGILVSGGNGFLSAESDEGINIWMINEIAIVDNPPVIVNTTIVVSCTKYKGSTGVVAFDLITGTFLWMIKTPSQLNAPIEFGGKIAYASSGNGPVVGIQPPGIYVLNGFDLTLTVQLNNTDCLGGEIKKPKESTKDIQYIGQFDNSNDCKVGCEASFRNTTAYNYYGKGYAHSEWIGGCYCRTDGQWTTQNVTGAASGCWTPPEIEHVVLWPSNTFWSSAAEKDGFLYIAGGNRTHDVFLSISTLTGLKEWSYQVELDTPGVPVVYAPSINSVEVVFPSRARGGAIVAFQISQLPPDGPPSPAPWYRQAGYLSSLIVGSIALIVLIVCICLSKNDHRGGLDHASPGRKYQVVSKLGSGSYGVVFLVKRKTDKVPFALKYLSCDSDEAQERALLEFRTMRTFQGHPNMIRVQETFMNWKDSSQDSESRSKEAEPLLDDIRKFGSPKYVCLVMPFYRQGDLKKFVLETEGPIPEQLLLDFTAQICSLMEFLHGKEPPLIHRDLKPENILLTDDCKSIVVTDFGLAKRMHNQYCATRAGTLCYMAPECWAHHYSKEADMWAIGCILYSVATKRLEEYNIRVMFSEALQTDSFQPSIEEELSSLGYPTIGKIASALVEPNYHIRPSARDVMNWLGVEKYDPYNPNLPIVRDPSAAIPIVTWKENKSRASVVEQSSSPAVQIGSLNHGFDTSLQSD
eukprot:TRINITY_DN7157_c0_g1_i1.p1 TRINITY_DN7157_c0_g1~~TRINITY_DN7157_c0_g1_i1.p1  ORF type:complete len:897 (+),score=144.08 TRINITY_DN7157_c0_g1_i1:220-2910(+)